MSEVSDEEMDADGRIQGSQARRTREGRNAEGVATRMAGPSSIDQGPTDVETQTRSDEVRELLKKRKRKNPSLSEKCAAALLTICRADADGRLAPVVDRELARTMTAQEIIGCFQFDHVVLHAFAGSNHPSNLVPRPVAEHRAKSAVDTTIVAKVRRLATAHEEFRRRVLLPRSADDVEPSCPTKTKPKRIRLKGRGFQGSRRFDGSVNWKRG